jgi:hypothetical protein
LSLLNIVCDTYGEYQVGVTQPLRTPSAKYLASLASKILQETHENNLVLKNTQLTKFNFEFISEIIS